MRQKESFLLCLWPSKNTLESRSLLEEMLMQQGCMIEQKRKITLDFWEFSEFIFNTYEEESWACLDGRPLLSGILRKAVWCYAKRRPLSLYLIRPTKLKPLLDVRDRLRLRLAIGKNSVHVMENTALSNELWCKYTAQAVAFSLCSEWKRNGLIRLQRRSIQLRNFLVSHRKR